MRLNEFASGDSGGGVDHAHSLMRYKKIMRDKGVAEATGDEEFDTMLSKITSPTAVNVQNREDTVNELIRTYFWHKRRADLGPEKTHEHGHEKIVLKILKKLNRMGIDLAKVDPVKLKMIKSQVYEQGVAEGPENNTTAQKIFFARSNIAPKSWSYDHVGFITQDGKQIQMSGHRGNDVYVTNDVTDDPAFPKQNIKIVSLSKPVSVPTTNSIGAENCGTFVANVLKSNGIKGIDTEKLYSVMKKPREQGVTEDTQSEDIDQITRDFVQHYENDPMGVFMHAKSSYLDAVGKAKHFSRKAAALYKSHANMSKQEFQDTVMKYFGKHLQNNGFPPHASEGWGKAEHELVKDLMNLDNQGVTEGQLNEKFKSQQQAKLMYAVAGNKDVSKKTGVSQKVAKEFIKKSHDQKVSQLPKKVKKTTEEIQTGGSKGLPFPGTYEQETNKFKYKGQRRTPTL